AAASTSRSSQLCFPAAEPDARALLSLARLFFTITRSRADGQRGDQPLACPCDLVDPVVEAAFVSPRRPIHPAQFANELKRRCANLVIGRGWFEVRQRFDISAHGQSLLSASRAGLIFIHR